MIASIVFIQLVCLVLAAAAVHRDEHEVCNGHPFAQTVEWISDPTLKALVSKRAASPIPSFQVNLGACLPLLQPRLHALTHIFRPPPSRTVARDRKVIQKHYCSPH